MTRSSIEDHLREMTWPEPAPELRARVLAPLRPPARSIAWSDRVWFSRGWRLAALGAVAFIAIGQWLVSRDVPLVIDPSGVRAVADAAQQVGLPPELATALERSASINARANDMELLRNLENADPSGDRR